VFDFDTAWLDILAMVMVLTSKLRVSKVTSTRHILPPYRYYIPGVVEFSLALERHGHAM
jgi:hypothetical protein